LLFENMPPARSTPAYAPPERIERVTELSRLDERHQIRAMHARSKLGFFAGVKVGILRDRARRHTRPRLDPDANRDGKAGDEPGKKCQTAQRHRSPPELGNVRSRRTDGREAPRANANLAKTLDASTRSIAMKVPG